MEGRQGALPDRITVEEVEKEAGGRDKLEPEDLVEAITNDIHKAYETREEEVGGEEVLRNLERNVLLEVIDRKWREHLYEMDYLKEGITLRAYAQRDPVIEYQREGYDMFNVMLDGIKEDTVRFLFNLNVKVQENEEKEQQPAADKKGKGRGRKPSPSSSAMATVTARGAAASSQPEKLSYSAPTLDGEGGVEVSQEVPSALRGGKRSGPSSKVASGAKKAAPGQRVGTARDVTSRATAGRARSTSVATELPAATDRTVRYLTERECGSPACDLLVWHACLRGFRQKRHPPKVISSCSISPGDGPSNGGPPTTASG